MRTTSPNTTVFVRPSPSRVGLSEDERLTSRADRSAHRSIFVLIIPATPLPAQRLFFAKPPFCLDIFRQLLPLEPRIRTRVGIVADNERDLVRRESRRGGGSGWMCPARRVDLTRSSRGRASGGSVGICIFGYARRGRRAGEGRRVE